MDVVKDYISKYVAEERNAVLGGNAAKFWRLKLLENQARD
jgi:predicted TIM-barrel fold metal-dependent hydrolase